MHIVHKGQHLFIASLFLTVVRFHDSVTICRSCRWLSQCNLELKDSGGGGRTTPGHAWSCNLCDYRRTNTNSYCITVRGKWYLKPFPSKGTRGFPLSTLSVRCVTLALNSEWGSEAVVVVSVCVCVYDSVCGWVGCVGCCWVLLGNN